MSFSRVISATASRGFRSSARGKNHIASLRENAVATYKKLMGDKADETIVTMLNEMCIRDSIYIMVILDNSRTLGAFERQSRILHN